MLSGSSSGNREYPQWPESTDIPRGISRCIWYNMDNHSYVSWMNFLAGRAINTKYRHCSDTATNEQKKDWFLRLNPNGKLIVGYTNSHWLQSGRIPILIDNTQSPPFPVMETSAELIYLLKLDKDHHFGFEDEREQSELLQWLFFWHGSGAPYQGNLGFFRRAQEQSTCKLWHIPVCQIESSELI